MKFNDLRLVFWELTAACNLRCRHCRAEASEIPSENELTTRQILSTAEKIRSFCDPIIILTGGEPLVRDDFFTIAEYCGSIFTRVALATNGTLLDDKTAARIKNSGISRVSISIDGAGRETHDRFRGADGSFDSALRGCRTITDAGLSLQINSTLTRENCSGLNDILNLALTLKADAFHLFVLVPVGCGAEIAEDQRIPPEQLNDILKGLLRNSIKYGDKIHIRATCAPQYYRLIMESASRKELDPGKFSRNGMQGVSGGCLAGSSVCFISRKGDVQPCGYMPVKAGNLTTEDFFAIWNKSEVFEKLRNPALLKGKCGTCGFRSFCRGCRARALAKTGDFLSEDPDCFYTL
jgi:radical SAM protein with 4Fe4S-binding SPASM domain